jgi:hypothetical protein
MSFLKKLMVDTKDAWVEYPGLRGFEVQIANLSRPELVSLRKRCTFQKFDRKTRQPVEELDDKKFVSEFTKATVKDWRGLTLGKLEQLVLVDIAGQSPDTEVPFSQEDAELLVENSSDFDQWLNEVVFDLENFRTTGTRKPVEPTGEVAE